MSAPTDRWFAIGSALEAVRRAAAQRARVNADQDAALNAAIVAALNAQAPKQDVAKAAGISRQTLDTWLATSTR